MRAGQGRAGQSRSRPTITSPPPLPSPGEPQHSRGPAPLISGQNLKKPRVCSELSPWSPWNPHGTAEAKLGVPQGHPAHQAEQHQPQLSPDWSPAPALHLAACASDPFACQPVCFKGFLFWLQGGVPSQREVVGLSLARPTFSHLRPNLTLDPLAGWPLEIELRGQR